LHRSTITRAASAVLVAAAVGPLGAATASAEASTVVDNFSNGVTAGTAVTGGNIQLQSPLDETFDGGPDLPAGWTVKSSSPWSGGVPTVAGGVMTVDGARVDSGVTAGPGTVLDFQATFSADAFEHVGLGTPPPPSGDGTGFENPPWAMFSTFNAPGPAVYMRTDAGVPTNDTPPIVPNILVEQSHHYRIAWTAAGFDYSVDGGPPQSTSTPMSSPMSPQISDLSVGGGGVTVESMKLTRATGTYTSDVLDGGAGFVTGIALDATPTTPTGSTISYETRTGTTSTPDASWSDWEAVGAGGSVASPNRRYLQYRATLTLNTAASTPALSRVAVDFAIDDQGPTSSVSDVAVNGTSATAHFSSDDAGATYECRLDSGAFSACTSPVAFSGLSVGTHTFSVRGTDTHDNLGNTASKSFTIAPPPSQTPSGGSGSSSAPPASGTAAVTTQDKVAPRLGITPKSVRVSKTGRVTLKVKCPSGETRCKVTMRLKLNGVTVAKKTTTIRGGKTVSVSLQLSASARAKLARRGSLKVTASGTATDAAGNVKVTSTHITLKTSPTHR
jgi:hypothetical protein